MSENNDHVGGLEALTDEILFARYKGGEKKAFDILLKRYQAPIFSFILKSIYNRAEAEEIFQDVFFKVIEKRDQFEPSVSFKAWLYTICRNTCIDVIRKYKRRPFVDSIFEDEEKPLEIRIQGNEISPDTHISGAQLEGFLEEAFKKVPPEQRETFYLKVKGELTFEEIGETMNCSVNTAKSRMRYAVEILKDIFEKRGYLK